MTLTELFQQFTVQRLPAQTHNNTSAVEATADLGQVHLHLEKEMLTALGAKTPVFLKSEVNAYVLLIERSYNKFKIFRFQNLHLQKMYIIQRCERINTDLPILMN